MKSMVGIEFSKHTTSIDIILYYWIFTRYKKKLNIAWNFLFVLFVEMNFFKYRISNQFKNNIDIYLFDIILLYFN